MKAHRVERRAGQLSVVDGAGSPVEACSRFLERLDTRGLSSFTVEAYAYDLALIHRWMKAAGLHLEGLKADDLHRFLAWERGRDTQPKSINRRLHTLRLYYRFACGQELPGGVEERGHRRRFRRDYELGLQRVLRPSVRQVRVKEARTVVEPLTVEQVRELVTSLRRYRDLCIAHLMLLCGLRTNEVLQLGVPDIDFEDRRIRVRGKGGKERMVPLAAAVVNLLRRYLALERPGECGTDRAFVVLQGRQRGKPMTRAALRRVFRTRRAQKALSNANPHRLRHTFGTDMARSGVRLPILQRMMGHAYAETTLQYVNVSLADVASEFHRALEKIEARYNGEEGPR